MVSVALMGLTAAHKEFFAALGRNLYLFSFISIRKWLKLETHQKPSTSNVLIFHTLLVFY